MKKNILTSGFILTFISASILINAQDVWVKKANYGGGNRQGACGFSIGNTGYFMTGLKVDSDYCDVWGWNQTLNVWTKKDSFPGGVRMGAATASLNGYGYLSGGEHASNCYLPFRGGVCGGVFYSDFWRYSADSDSWTQLTNFPGGGREFAVMVADPLDTAIYYGTGNGSSFVYLSDWWMYKISTATWTQLTDFPGGARTSAVGFFLNGNIYVGTGNNNTTAASSSDMWKYDVTNDSWTQVANVPGTARAQASTFTIGDFAYVGGGSRDDSTYEDSDLIYNLAYMNDFWKYDANQNTWTVVADYPQGDGSLESSFSIGDKGYVGLGTFSGNDTSAFWEYTPDSTTGINTLLQPNVKVNLFPNPSSGMITILYANITKNTQLKIVDVLGNIVDFKTITNEKGKLTLDETKLSNGVYFYQFLLNNNSLFIGKFIISK